MKKGFRFGNAKPAILLLVKCLNNPVVVSRNLTANARCRVRCVAAGRRRASLWAFRAKSAQEIGNQAYRQDQANPAAADDGTAKVKPAAAEQEK
jgi:hypothetical protein